MGFLNNKYKPWTISWVIQRIVVVIKEGRYPQFWIFKNIPARTKPLQSFAISCDPSKEHLINRYFDNIYVLNLAKRPDKCIEVITRLRKHHIKAEIVYAVDGYNEENLKAYEKYKNAPLGAFGAHRLEKKYMRKMITSPGGWGVLKSKKMILKDALKKKYKRILILQDDVILIKDFHRRFESFVSKTGNDWKIIGLGATQHTWTVPGSIFYDDKTITFHNPDLPYYYPLRTDGAFALGYDRSVFKYLIRRINKMNCSFDSGPVRDVYDKYQGKCFIAQPNLVIADVNTSDIRPGRNQKDFSEKMKWDPGLYADHTVAEELVSVIMPAYNAEKTIEKSIRSVLNQSHKNLELIIVDDGSDDKTGEIVRRLMQEDERIVYHKNTKNRGCYFVRNDGLRLAKGKYIAINDSDDISLGNRLKKQMISLVAGNALFTVSKIIRSNRNIDELDFSDEIKLFDILNNDQDQINNSNSKYFNKSRLGLNTTMFHRDLFSEYGLFWENRFGADAEILERIIYKKTGFLVSDERQTIGSLFNDVQSMPQIYQVIDEVLLISSEMNEDNLSNRYKMHGGERAVFRKLYRDRLLGINQYDYPVF